MTRAVLVFGVCLSLLLGERAVAQRPSEVAEPENTTPTRAVGTTAVQESEDRTIAGILEALIRDLRGEIRELRRELREEMKELADDAVEESQRAVREGLVDARRLYLAAQSRLDGLTVDVGPCEERLPDRTYHAATAGIAVAAMNQQGDSRSGVQGFVAPVPEILEGEIDRQYRRGGASVRYANIDAYLLYDSITMPVGEGEYWRFQIGYGNGTNTNFSWCPLGLKASE